MNIYVTIALAGTLGIVLYHWRKIAKIFNQNPDLSMADTFKQFWKYDKASVITSVLAFVAVVFCASELVNLNHLEQPDPSVPLAERLANFKIANFIRIGSVVMGWASGSIVYSWLGKTEEKLKSIVESPTDK